MTIRFLRRGRLFGKLNHYHSMALKEHAIPNDYADSDSFGITVLSVSRWNVDCPIIAVPCEAVGFHLAKLHIQTIEDLPDKCVLQILRLLSINDLCRVRLVNRRLNRMIQRHYETLAKKHIKGMTIYGLPNGELNFDRQFSSDNACFIDSEDSLEGALTCDHVWESSLKHMCLDGALRHVVVSDCLCMESANFDHALRHSLQRSFRGPLPQLQFVDCTTNIRYDEFAFFINRMRVKELTMLNCILEDAQLIGDVLFANNKQLDFISIQFTGLQDLPLLTNETLRIWSSEMTWPSSFVLHNVKSCFNIVGIGLMIESYFLYCYRSEEIGCSLERMPILWNFGIVDGEVADILVTLRSIGSRATILKPNATDVAVIVRYTSDSPPLHIRMKCQK